MAQSPPRGLSITKSHVPSGLTPNHCASLRYQRSEEARSRSGRASPRFRQARLPANPTRPEPTSKSEDGSGVVLGPMSYTIPVGRHLNSPGEKSSTLFSVSVASALPTKVSIVLPPDGGGTAGSIRWSKDPEKVSGATSVAVGDAPKGGATTSPLMKNSKMLKPPLWISTV